MKILKNKNINEKDDRILEENKKELVDFDEAFDNLLYYNKEELEDKIAIMNTKEEIIIKMLDKGYNSIQEIEDITGYKEKEIEKVWERHLLEEAMEKDTETLHKLIRELIAKHPGITYQRFVEITTHLNPQEIETILNEDPKK